MVTAFHDPANTRIGIDVDASGTPVWLNHAPGTINPTATARPALGVANVSSIIVGLNPTDETAAEEPADA